MSDGFIAFVLEQVEALGPITSKKMFGGVGLYAGDQFFGLVSKDVLYLKADDSTRAAMKKAGARPFKPFADRPASVQYYSVPAAILEDSEVLLAWAKQSIAIARAQHS